MGVDGGSVFWELVGSIGATAAVGVPVSSVEGGGVTGAGTVLAASAWVLFCDGVRLGSVRAVNRYGSVLRDAVLEGKTDFIRLLLEHG